MLWCADVRWEALAAVILQNSRRRALAPALSAVAGFVDVAGFLSLDLFTAHMSGNSARLGAYLSGGKAAEAAESAFAIAVFVLGIAVGTAVMEVLSRAGRRSPAAIVLAAEAALLVSLAVVGDLVAVRGGISRNSPRVYFPLAAIAVLAMGLQTPTLQRVSGKTVRTTYISGMLTSLAEEAVAYVLGPAPGPPAVHRSYIETELGIQPRRASLGRMGLIISIWLMYAGGGILGGYLERQLSFTCFFVPSAVLAGIVLIELLSPSPPLAPSPQDGGGASTSHARGG